jgi:tripartite-type tricarboxylate transporter receptor subunit TctC
VWGQSVIVEYKPGAGTALGTDFAAKAAPDGHTLCLVATPHVINPAMRQLPFDTVKDLSGITILGTSNVLISATSAYPANTLRDAVELIKKNPTKFAYASPGSGSSMHFAMELLKQRAGIELLHAPFKGSGPAYPEVFSGRIDFLVDPLFSSLPHVKSGKLNALAVGSTKRHPIASDVPTLVELGYKEIDVDLWYGFFAPARTPTATINKLNAELTSILQQPQIREILGRAGMDASTSSPDELAAIVAKDYPRWGRVIQLKNIAAE